MVNWNDPAEIGMDYRVYQACTLVLAGLATWEVVVTFPFDWSIITGRRKWRWPMALYFLCRLCLLLETWTLAIHSNAVTEVNCGLLCWIDKVAEAGSICLSSLILGLRTYAVWGKNKRVGAGLVAFSIGQIAMWGYLTVFWTSVWNPTYRLCEPTSMPAKPSFYISNYSYTIAFDCVTLALIIVKLFRHAGSGGICAVLLSDGIIYFIVTVIVNGTAATFAGLQLNVMMNTISIPTASVISTIAATYLFRHTFEFDCLSPGQVAGTAGIAVSSMVFRKHDSQTFVSMDVPHTQTLGMSSVGVDIRGEMDMERTAESDYGKKITQSILPGNFLPCVVEPPKVHSL